MQSLSNVAKRLNSSSMNQSSSVHSAHERWRSNNKIRTMQHIKNRAELTDKCIKPKTAGNSQHRIKRKIFKNISNDNSVNSEG